MRDIPAQLHNIRKTTLGEIVISFRVDEMYNDSVQDLFLKKIGTEFIMKLEDVTTRTVLGGKTDEVNDDTRTKFFRQYHAKLNDFCERSGQSENEAKERVFKSLKQKGMIVESSKDMGIKELAVAIGILDKWLKD